ncbi:MAG: sensor domain-containing diguanylate cyclase [Candidatus Omnitrophica bacterium]|nr:sensor domain-containing diguanylate cyclase [Candidatus Omnitrophota bacterium]
MRQLISIVSIVFIYTVSLLAANYTKNYYFIFNLCVIPLIVSGYFFSEFNSLLLVSFCCILNLSFIFIENASYGAFQNIFLLLTCVSLSTVMKKDFNGIKIRKEDELKTIDATLASLRQEAVRVKNSRTILEHKSAEIGKLYHSAKKMASCSGLEDLLNTMRDIIADSLKFKKCELITVYYAQDSVKIDKIYQITKEKITQVNMVDYEEGLLKLMLRRKQHLVIDGKQGSANTEDFAFPEYLNTFAAFPIMSGEKTNAILAIEEFDTEQKDLFAVIANQFSMALERARLYELVQELAITDGLTGVFVRRHMLQRLDEELVRAAHFNTRVSLLMIDIDDFKKYNDKHGHLKGDVLLKEAAAILKNGIREIDIIGRYGGEEFCLVFPDTDSKGAEFVANRLRESVKSIDATISVGISAYPHDAGNVSQLIERADKMLYKAKQSGKDKVCIYEK